MTKIKRNKEIIRLFKVGLKLKDIAIQIGISESIVKHVVYEGNKKVRPKPVPLQRAIPTIRMDRVKILGKFGDYTFEEISHETGLKLKEVQMILLRNNRI